MGEKILLYNASVDGFPEINIASGRRLESVTIQTCDAGGLIVDFTLDAVEQQTFSLRGEEENGLT